MDELKEEKEFFCKSNLYILVKLVICDGIEPEKLFSLKSNT